MIKFLLVLVMTPPGAWMEARAAMPLGFAPAAGWLRARGEACPQARACRLGLEDRAHGLGLFDLQRVELRLATSLLSMAISEPTSRADMLGDGRLVREAPRLGSRLRLDGAPDWRSVDQRRVPIGIEIMRAVRERPANAADGSVRAPAAARFDWKSFRLYLNGVEHAQLAIAGSIAMPGGPLRIGANGLADQSVPARGSEILTQAPSSNPNEIQLLLTTPFR